MGTRRMAIIERARTERLHKRSLFWPPLLRIQHRAAGPMFMRDFNQRRNGVRTLGHAKSATWLERAARGHRVQRWDCSFDRPQRTPTLRLQVRHGVQESASIRMCWFKKYFAPRPEFYKISGIHHRHAVG